MMQGTGIQELAATEPNYGMSGQVFAVTYYALFRYLSWVVLRIVNCCTATILLALPLLNFNF